MQEREHQSQEKKETPCLMVKEKIRVQVAYRTTAQLVQKECLSENKIMASLMCWSKLRRALYFYQNT